MLQKDLLDILVCPQCKGALVVKEDEQGLLCYACELEYEIRDDIPVMLVDKAKKIEN